MWTADVPGGTSMTFKVCTAESQEELDTCDYIDIATYLLERHAPDASSSTIAGAQ